MTQNISEEQYKALVNRFVHLIQIKNMPNAIELKHTLTILGIHIPEIHDATTVDLYQYRQRAIRG